MRIAVRKESASGERRVAIVPDSVKRLASKKIEVVVEAGAGVGAYASDADYEGVGARVDAGLAAMLAEADALVQIRPPTLEEVAALREGSVLVSLLYPLVSPDLVRALAARKVTSIAVDMIPRTTVAQMMDVLSSSCSGPGWPGCKPSARRVVSARSSRRSTCARS